MDVETAFSNAWNNIVTKLGPIVMRILNIIVPFVAQLIAHAIRAGVGFVRGIITYIAQLPGRFVQYLTAVRLRILAQMMYWITVARNRIVAFVTGIINGLISLPGRVLSSLLRVVSSIISAGAKWINAGKQKVNELVKSIVDPLTSVPDKISSALSGVVNAIKKPFDDAWNALKPTYDTIVNAMNTIANGAPRGGEFARGGETLASNQFVVSDSNNKIEVNENINLVIDLKNVPDNVDENTLIEALTSNKVVNALVNNKNFQDLDAKVKERLLLKSNRARGV